MVEGDDTAVPVHAADVLEHVVIQPSVLYVGTPVFLVASENADGTPNLAAASSYWALGQMLVLGLEADGQSALNLQSRPQLTVSFPSGPLWRSVARLADLTGRNPVPESKAHRYRYEPDKFATAGLSPQPSEIVAPPRVKECHLQFEAVTRRLTLGLDGSYYMVEAEVLRVHATREILTDNAEHVDPREWDPLVYSFRHFFGRGQEMGWLASSRVETSGPDLDVAIAPDDPTA